MRIALLVPDPDYPEPWQWAFDPEAEALRKVGVEVVPIAWTQDEDLSAFDLVLPLLVWGYHLNYPQWLAFLDKVEAHSWPMVNSPTLLKWNGDKAYLAELAQNGVATVPTLAVDCCCDADLDEARRRFSTDWLVIKPPVSASASGTHRLGPNDEIPVENRGRPTIIQPLIKEIAKTGEFSLILFDGILSHAVVKRPRSGDFRVQPHYGGTTFPCVAPPGSEELARQALAGAPAKATYARVDLVPDDEGTLRIMELELIEPALFLDYKPGSSELFSRAILRSVQKATAG